MLVDCGAGMGAEQITANLEDAGFGPGDIDWIVVTHSHADHSGGAAKLRQLLGARIICSPQTARIVRVGEAAMGLEEARQRGWYPQEYRYAAFEPDAEISGGEQLVLGDLTVEFLETPGHAHDQLSLYCPELQALFCSDVVFAGGRIAVQQAADFSLPSLAESIGKLADLRITGLFPGHWEPLPTDGGETLQAALRTFQAGLVPDSIV